MLGITPCKVNEMENPKFASKALGREVRARLLCFPHPSSSLSSPGSSPVPCV